MVNGSCTEGCQPAGRATSSQRVVLFLSSATRNISWTFRGGRRYYALPETIKSPGRDMKYFSLLKRKYLVLVLQAVVLSFAFVPTAAQQIDPQLFESLRWRGIGAHRG